MSFYAYLHARPDTVDAVGIFYVGKGRGGRCYNLRRNNAYHRNVVVKYGVSNIQVSRIECSSEEIAFELEKGLIKCLRNMGVKLTNMTDGGDGPSGFIRSPESNKLVSDARKGVSGGKHSEKSRAAISEQTRASWNNPEVRNSRTNAIRVVRDVIGEKSKAAWTDDRRKRHAENVSARYADEEFRAKASEKASEFQSSSEYRARMSEAVKQAWTDELKQKQRDNVVGRVWLNNGVKCIRAKETDVTDLITQGWVKGRKLI